MCYVLPEPLHQILRSRGSAPPLTVPLAALEDRRLCIAVGVAGSLRSVLIQALRYAFPHTLRIGRRCAAPEDTRNGRIANHP